MISIGNRSGQATVTTVGNDRVPDNVFLLEGASLGTIVKSLEIIGGTESCKVTVTRTDGSEPASSPTQAQVASAAYAVIPVDLKANDYLVLWEGFFVVPSGHRLYFSADSTQCRAVVNYVCMSS